MAAEAVSKPLLPKWLKNPAIWGLSAAVAMFGMAFVAVPLYQLFCQVTGYGGTTQTASGPADKIGTSTIHIQFDANVSPDLNWEFKPDQREISVHPGENTLAFFTVTNRSDHAVTAVASYNVTPFKAGPYFQKLECFCFQDRTLEAGETMQLPVIFYVDPAIEDKDGAPDVADITLSYTFLPVPKH